MIPWPEIEISPREWGVKAREEGTGKMLNFTGRIKFERWNWIYTLYKFLSPVPRSSKPQDQIWPWKMPRSWFFIGEVTNHYWGVLLLYIMRFTGKKVAPKLMMVRGRHQEQAQSENAVLVGGAGWCLHAQSFTAKYQSIAYGIICIYIYINNIIMYVYVYIYVCVYIYICTILRWINN